MRAALALITLTVTSVVAVSFLVPLALLVRTQARSEATGSAEQRAAALAPLLVISDRPAELRGLAAGLGAADQLGVHLPDGELIGTTHASDDLIALAVQGQQPVTRDVPGGWDYLQPVLLHRDRVAVVEEFVPTTELHRGVAADWTVLVLLALLLVAGAVLATDRLAVRTVRSSRGLARASAALGAGDLDVRVEPAGPRELREAGLAFNAMADHIAHLLATERELAADLSHRLRTPLTALYLAVEQLGPVPGVQRLAAAAHHLESELDSIIHTARTPPAREAAGLDSIPEPRSSGRARPDRRSGASCEVSAVVRHRVGFWSVLAAQQGRGCRFTATDEATPVRLPEDDLAAVVDALVGNIFRHTPSGAPFVVSVQRTAQSVVLVVEDGGDGIRDPESALSRGVSPGGSTGLGLDIARRAAGSTRGSVRILRSPLGGARVEVVLGLAAEPRRSLGAPWRHRRRRTAEPRRRR